MTNLTARHKACEGLSAVIDIRRRWPSVASRTHTRHRLRDPQSLVLDVLHDARVGVHEPILVTLFSRRLLGAGDLPIRNLVSDEPSDAARRRRTTGRCDCGSQNYVSHTQKLRGRRSHTGEPVVTVALDRRDRSLALQLAVVPRPSAKIQETNLVVAGVRSV